jgi:hypothetical protein
MDGCPDPATAQNPRRAVYHKIDEKLEILNDFLWKSGAKGGYVRDLEAGVAWLLWMLGFSVAHLGGSGRTQDAADLVATAPQGHFAVVECTTEQLKADKLSLLVERADRVRQGPKRGSVNVYDRCKAVGQAGMIGLFKVAEGDPLGLVGSVSLASQPYRLINLCTS